ncbi:hypothetical protein [Aquimonas sp.]|jgi:uncharacterized Zn finger protein|uniref:hypothetical protein n=1 Tax=Aquimonas sp. TaxID=1872588 RepID=UPI0037BFB3AD
MELYWKRVEGLIAELKPRAYETSGAHLREMRAVYLQTQRAELWQSKLAALRPAHKAKTHLQAVLETLEPAVGAQPRRSPLSF